MTSFRNHLVLLPLALLGAASLFAQSRQDLRDADVPRDLPWTDANTRAKSLYNAGSEKVDPALLALANQVRSKGLDDLDTIAKSLSIQVQDDMVAVSLLADSESDIDALRKEVSRRGGRISTTYKNQVYVLLPPAEIASLAKVDSLYSATRPNMYFPDRDESKGDSGLEGVLKIKADHLHKAGFRGQGVKVGVLDFGFQRYDELKASGKVPAPVQAKAFTATGRLDVNTEHGTACVEIVHAMAPDAQIFIAAVDGDEGQIIGAAQWLRSQGVDVISFSGGGHGGPHNGTGTLDQLVDEMTRDHKLLWVNSAGNEGDSHLLVEFPGGGAPGWIPITPDVPFIKVASASPQIALFVNWDDWGSDPQHPSGTQDIDLGLFHIDKASGKPELVAQSANEQNGRLPPMEFINATNIIPKEIYYLGLHATHVTKPVRIHVYLNAHVPEDMLPVSATGSIAIPATSPAALAVGAVDVANDKLEPFSSRGPTDDNRAKPELSSYDNVTSVAFGKNFHGTSASCPHVSGLAALFKSQNRDADATALRAKLMASLRPATQGEPGFGAGITDVSVGEGGGSPGKAGELPTGSLALPESFGGAVDAASIEELSRSREEQPFTVKVRLGRDGNPPAYRIGDDLRLGYSTAEDSYCTLVNRNASGEYTVLPIDTERLEGGKKYVYPDKITVSEPTGSEEFLFICSKDRVDLKRWRQASGRVSVAVAEYEVKP